VGADVNAQDRQRDSAFLLAGARGHTEIVRATLAAGAQPEQHQPLRRHGADPGLPPWPRGDGAPAAEHRHRRRPRQQPGLDGAARGGDPGRWRPGPPQIVRLLLGRRAQPNLADRDGVTPLQHAERRGFREMVELLRAAGARPAP
jgi:ankyrin repeat protein